MANDRWYCVYILASRSRTLYVGFSSRIEQRMLEHRTGVYPGFTQRYRCHRLVYFERHVSALAGIAREKQIKGWLRARKIELIERTNPGWCDLSENWGEPLRTDE